MKIILSILYVMMTTSGITFMKLGGDSLGFSLKGGFSFKVGYLTLVGLLCYLVSFLLWQKLLVTFDLTYIVPIVTGIVQIIILLLGLFIFKENINWIGILGILLVIAGIVLMVFGKAKLSN